MVLSRWDFWSYPKAYPAVALTGATSVGIGVIRRSVFDEHQRPMGRVYALQTTPDSG
jgi:hypothetical protein